MEYEGRWTKLRWSVVIGYVDHVDAVHSQIFSMDGEYPAHDELFGKVLKGWRWDYSDGIDFSVFAGKLDSEDRDRVRRHLTKKYGIPFMDNGYHDVQLMTKKINEEENGSTRKKSTNLL